jgi:hypothetical protein
VAEQISASIAVSAAKLCDNQSEFPLAVTQSSRSVEGNSETEDESLLCIGSLIADEHFAV